jgi:hypothetical protein
MSGGSWDYVFGKFNDVAERLKRDKKPYRKQFAKLVKLVGDAMYEIEWEDSDDTGPGDSIPAIKKALGIK